MHTLRTLAGPSREHSTNVSDLKDMFGASSPELHPRMASEFTRKVQACAREVMCHVQNTQLARFIIAVERDTAEASPAAPGLEVLEKMITNTPSNGSIIPQDPPSSGCGSPPCLAVTC